MEQLCWKCSKATNGNLCPWVKCFMYPDGVKLDGENNIVYCPLFKADERRKIRRQTIISNRFGISERTYYRHKIEYDALYDKYKYYKYLPKITDLCEIFHESKQKIIKNYEFYLKKYLTSNCNFKRSDYESKNY